MRGLSNMEESAKNCQSCIERYGKNVQATREWTPGVFYCEDCFGILLNNLTNLPNGVEKKEYIAVEISKDKPFLIGLYDYFEVPSELRYEQVDKVLNARDKFFNWRAPAVVNKSLEELAQFVEEMSSAMFVVKYLMEPHTLQINKLKEEKRKEKNLSNVEDSKEAYSKPKKAAVGSAEDKKYASMAKAMGVSIEELKANIKKMREREFDKLVKGDKDDENPPLASMIK